MKWLIHTAILLILFLNPLIISTKGIDIIPLELYEVCKTETYDLKFQNRKAGSFKSRLDFIEFITPYAIISAIKTGTNGPGQIAQFILETNGGNSKLTKRSNNLGCIHCHYYYFPDGTPYWNKNDNVYNKDDEAGLSCFRKYNNLINSVYDQGYHFQKSPRFRKCLNIKNSSEYIDCLTNAGYATGADYAKKIKKILDDYNIILKYNNVYNKNHRDIYNYYILNSNTI